MKVLIALTQMMLLMQISFQIKANESQIVYQAKQLFIQGKYKQAEQLLDGVGEHQNSEIYYLLAIINDPEYHYISIQPGYPEYDEIKDKKAKYNYKKAVDLGHCFAHYYLNEYQQSRHSRRWVSRATTTYSTNLNRRYLPIKKCLENKIFKDTPEALYLLGKVIRKDRPDPAIKVKPSVNKIRKMAESGNSQAQYYMGRIMSEWYFRDETMRDYEEGFAWLTAAAFQGVNISGVYALYVFEEKLDDEKQQTAQALAGKYINKYIQ